jgi:hypothetical protein
MLGIIAPVRVPSLVLSCSKHVATQSTMDAREVKVIDTSGRNGQPGRDNWTRRPAEGKYPQ